LSQTFQGFPDISHGETLAEMEKQLPASVTASQSYLTPWGGIIFETSIVAQKIKKSKQPVEPKARCRVQKSLSLVPILSQMNPVHAPIIILWPLLANIPVNVK
jgi:hypothetical protein